MAAPKTAALPLGDAPVSYDLSKQIAKIGSFLISDKEKVSKKCLKHIFALSIDPNVMFITLSNQCQTLSDMYFIGGIEDVSIAF